MNIKVEDHIDQVPEGHRKMMVLIWQLNHHSVHEVLEEFNGKRPVFRRSKDLFCLKNTKRYFTPGFFEKKKRDDAENQPEGSGNDRRHIKLITTEDIQTALLKKWFATMAAT